MKNITPGTKIARPYAGRFIKSEKGTLGLEVAFKFKEGDLDETLTWVGWLSEKAMERTMKTLVEVLGFNGDDSVDANSVLTNPKALNYAQDVSLVIEMEINPNDQKQYPRIKWVNQLGGSGFKGLAPESIKSELGAVGFKAAFMAARGQLGNLPEPKEETDVGF